MRRHLCDPVLGPFRILYVLVTSRGQGAEGRYASDDAYTQSEVDDFLSEYGAMFEQDARYAAWITGSTGQLVSTPRNVVYAYGPLAAFERELVSRGFVECDFSIPSPHVRMYHPAFDRDVRRLLESRAWTHSPLRQIDEET